MKHIHYHYNHRTRTQRNYDQRFWRRRDYYILRAWYLPTLVHYRTYTTH